MEPTADILRDIHGLDAVPWWPLAPGWWLLLGLLLLLLLGTAIRYWLYYCGLVPGWRGDARRQLRDLKKALRQGDARDVAGNLSILLRRVAIARSGRHAAAGLAGDEWLAWLAANDSTGFNWTKHGSILLQAPYMPPDMPVKRDAVMKLVVAAMRWVDTTAPVTHRPSVRSWRIPGLPRRQATDGAGDV